jgi:pimeloyl-ACP methyl ester carboxylesterase
VIVGTNLSEFAEMFLAGIPIWWLKLDGLHVRPHLNMDIPAQASRHVEELLAEFPTGNLLLFGYSYGGLVAFEVARQLCVLAGPSVQLALLEPAYRIPSRWDRIPFLSYRLKQHIRALSKRTMTGRISHLLTSFRNALSAMFDGLRRRLPRQPHIEIPIEDGWKYFAPFLHRHIFAYMPKSASQIDLHIVGRREYLESCRGHWEKGVAGKVTTYPMPNHLTHIDIKQGKHNSVWVNVMREIIADNENGSPE